MPARKGADGVGGDILEKRSREDRREDRYQEEVSKTDMLTGEIGQLFVNVKKKFTPGFLNRFKQSKVYTEVVAEAEV